MEEEVETMVKKKRTLAEKKAAKIRKRNMQR